MAFLDQITAQGQGIGQIPIVSQSHGTGEQLGIKGLNVLGGTVPCRGITHVPDGGHTRKLPHNIFRGKGIPHQSRVLLTMKRVVLKRDNPRSLLPPVLHGMQTQNRMGRGLFTAPDAKNATFFAQAIRHKGQT